MSNMPARFRLVAAALFIVFILTQISCEERYEPPGIQVPTNFDPGPTLQWEPQPYDAGDSDCFRIQIGDYYYGGSPKGWESDDGHIFVIDNRRCYQRDWCKAHILHNDGEKWLFPGFEYPEMQFTGIWGSSAEDVFVTGLNGVIMHFDGISWTQQYTGFNVDLLALWGSGPDDVFAVGDDGIILHFDGVSWTIDTCTGEKLIDIWGISSSMVLTISNRKMFRFDGSVWSEVPIDGSPYFRCIWGNAADNFYVGAGATIQHFDGVTMTQMYHPIIAGNIRGTSSDDVYISTSTWDTHYHPFGNRVVHFDGESWDNIELGERYIYWNYYLWGDRATGIHFLDYPDVIDLDFPDLYNTEFEEEQQEDSRCIYTINSLWGFSDEDVFAVDWTGNIIHYDGEVWSPMDSPTSEAVYELWGTRPDDVFAVGSEGSIIHYNGFEWQPMSSNWSADLNAVWGSEGDDVYAAGDDGSILHFDGREWSHTGFNTGFSLRAIWGSGPADIYIGGDSHTFYHFDGTDWDWVEYDDLEAITDIWGSASDDVYFVGSPSTIVHFNGEEWRYTDTDYTCGGFKAIGGTPEGRVYALTRCYYGSLLYLEDGKWLPERSVEIASFNDIWISPSGAIYGAGSYRSIVGNARVLVGRWE